MQVFYKYNSNRSSLLGPNLPIPLMDITHSTAPLGKGQAIFGGHNNYVSQNTIYVINCFSWECLISKLKQEISVPRSLSMVIPLPDIISGCVTGGIIKIKFYEQKPSLTYDHIGPAFKCYYFRLSTTYICW